MKNEAISKEISYRKLYKINISDMVNGINFNLIMSEQDLNTSDRCLEQSLRDSR